MTKEGKGYEMRSKHPLYEGNFDHSNPNDLLRNFRNPEFELRNLLRNFSIEKPAKVRYTLPNMPANYSNKQLQNRKKLYTLNHKNNANNNRSDRLSRISKNTNLLHQNTYGHLNDPNVQGFQQNDNVLIFKGQSLNGPLEQRLHSSNGGNLRNNKNHNFLMKSNITTPLIGINKKYHQHITSLPEGRLQERMGYIKSIL